MLLRAAFFFVGVGGSAAFRYCILNSINIQSTRGGVQRFPAHFFTPLLAVTIEDAASEEVPVSDNEGVASSGKQFDWEKQWYPLAVEEFTDKKKSHAMMFLGNNIVLWHDGKKWSVFEDACPHRGVPLSEGRVESNGELLCSYHAWTFNGKGECTSIPQTLTKEKEVSLLPKACVKSYPTQVLQGLIWVWGSKGAPGSDVALQAALKTPHIIDELEDPDVRPRISPLTWTFRDLPYGWDMFMENVADAAHVPVSHHGLTGNRYKDAQPITFKRKIGVTEIPVSDGGKLVPGFEEDAGFKYEMESYRGGKDIRITNDFRPPCLFKTKFENSTMTQFLYATPTKPGYCRFISVAITIKDPKNYTPGRLNGLPPLVPIPKWFLHLFLNLFMHQDSVLLHGQERMLYSSSNYAFGSFSNNPQLNYLTTDPRQYAKTYFMPNEQDKMVTHLRRWIHKKAGGGVRWGAAAGVQPLPSRLSNAEAFDVFHAHTEHCTHCSGALKNVIRLRNTALILAAISTGSLKSSMMKLVSSVFFCGIAFSLEKLRRFFFVYDFSHQDNN